MKLYKTIMRGSRSLWILGVLVFTIPSHAAVLISNLDLSTMSGLPGTTIHFTGTLTNPTSDPVFLNGDVNNILYIALTIDDSPFFANAPLFLAASGGSYSGPLFDVMIDAAATPGIYQGVFTVQGGADSITMNDLATENFQVQVDGNVPEPGSLALLLSGGMAVGLGSWATRKTRLRGSLKTSV